MGNDLRGHRKQTVDVLFLAFEIGNERLHRRGRTDPSNRIDRFGPNNGTAICEVVPVDTGQNAVFDLHQLDRARHALRLLPIHSIRPTGLYSAKATTAGADIPQDHEGRRTRAPALSHIWATPALTDRVQFIVVHELAHRTEVFSRWQLHSQPFGLSFFLLDSRWIQFHFFPKLNVQ